MSVVAILVGLGCGMLLAAVSLGLLSGYRGPRILYRGAHVAAWSAAGVLVIAALLAWGSGLPALESLIGAIDRQSLQGPALSLILMAALAIPLRMHALRKALWSSALPYLPAFLLAFAALVQIVAPVATVLGMDWVTPIRFALAVCGGLGARALGQSLQAIAAGIPYVEWPGALAYGLTTLLFGSASMVSLWWRGTLWSGADPVLRGGIASAWLAWTADWLAPRRYPRLRAVLTIVAALLLILAAIRPA
jgi:hypothetical protein